MLNTKASFLEYFNENSDVQLVKFAGLNLYHTEIYGQADYKVAINFIESEGNNSPVWFDFAEKNYALLHQKDTNFKYAKTYLVVLIKDGPFKGCYIIDTRAKDSNIQTEKAIPEGLRRLNFVLNEIQPERRLNKSAGVWSCYLQRSASLGYFFSIGKSNSGNKVPINRLDSNSCNNIRERFVVPELV
jgi:hypothetical protein